MGKYQVKISKSVEKELSIIKRSGRKADIDKLNIFFLEISNDPRSGTGKPEPLRHKDGEVWSRRLNKKDRFIYEIFEGEVLVVVIQALGHYDDK